MMRWKENGDRGKVKSVKSKSVKSFCFDLQSSDTHMRCANVLQKKEISIERIEQVRFNSSSSSRYVYYHENCL